MKKKLEAEKAKKMERKNSRVQNIETVTSEDAAEQGTASVEDAEEVKPL